MGCGLPIINSNLSVRPNKNNHGLQYFIHKILPAPKVPIPLNLGLLASADLNPLVAMVLVPAEIPKPDGAFVTPLAAADDPTGCAKPVGVGF